LEASFQTVVFESAASLRRMIARNRSVLRGSFSVQVLERD
jgi:hypothetical protein